MDPREYPLLHYADLMVALLRVAEERGEAAVGDAAVRLREDLARAGERPPVDEGELLARLGRARHNLFKAGALLPTHDQRFRITVRGRRVLAEHPEGIDDTVLMQFPEFRQYIRRLVGRPAADKPLSLAYDQGWAAYHGGVSHSDNPYRFDTGQHLAWENGWFEARDEEREHGRFAYRTREV